MELSKLSRAKINLFLRVVGKDYRGYHLLESYFALLKFGDTITIKESTKLSCQTLGALVEDENITLHAVKAVQEYIKTTRNVEITIEKKILIAAGLGGGSSNAGSAIKMLNELWELKLSLSEMVNIANSVGADVPFFIYEQNSFVTGTGDTILPLKLNITLPILLVNPKFKINTRDVYKTSVRSFSSSLGDITPSKIIKEIYEGFNDLEQPAIIIEPNIQDILNIIRKQIGCVISRMSGSGSTCFGIFEDEEHAFKALHNLKKLYPDFWYYYELLTV